MDEEEAICVCGKTGEVVECNPFALTTSRSYLKRITQECRIRRNISMIKITIRICCKVKHIFAANRKKGHNSEYPELWHSLTVGYYYK